MTSVKRGPCSAPACAILSELTLRRVAYAQQEGITAQRGGALTHFTNSERTCDRPYVDHGTERHNSLGNNVGPDLMGCRGMGTEIGTGLSGTWRTGSSFIEAPTSIM